MTQMSLLAFNEIVFGSLSSVSQKKKMLQLATIAISRVDECEYWRSVSKMRVKKNIWFGIYHLIQVHKCLV